ncbi:uncharacterized protein MYCFIDRAFT_212735 [Pseudocercospora fijiensis CIRAD86]|uniref:Uncharacterized protein n=1 Tax=Pseudocercospora fijiensis (strain CIRAD86) TaxID=383855 RepID=M3AI30_PSEFD|nr:uncharacterized protein MYCFIDRAFT_212735 [Pseudocercospora fijiensis CIRAD86]EME76863.1 hypothetical protein MYCFIDRAFT_212735 [Pseudocercospora fijiensis CIRAD86]
MHFHAILRDNSGTLTISLEDGAQVFLTGATNSRRRSYRLELEDDLDGVLPVGYLIFMCRWMHRVRSWRLEYEKDNELVETLMEMMMSDKNEDQERTRKRGGRKQDGITHLNCRLR